jgi:hypothetical protein
MSVIASTADADMACRVASRTSMISRIGILWGLRHETSRHRDDQPHSGLSGTRQCVGHY